MWYSLSISGLTPVLVEACSNRLFEIGAMGVEELDTTSLRAFFSPEHAKTAESIIREYLSDLKNIDGFENSSKVELLEHQNENWAEKWKEFYKPQTMGQSFFLRPLWDKKTEVPCGRKLIELEPGQAFGTGLHESTRLCIELIEKLSPFPKSVLDVGTGTGILSIAAEKLGAEYVLGTDIDPVAVEICQQNCRDNGCSKISVVVDSNLKGLDEQFDLLIANILLKVHQQLYPQYSSHLKPGGTLVLSGLLEGQEKELEDDLKKQGLTQKQVLSQGEWVAVAYEK